MDDVFYILNLDEDNDNKDEVYFYVIYGYDYHPEEYDKIIKEMISLKEFHLLMKIFFGVYDNKEYIDSLIAKEKAGEFEGLEKSLQEDFKSTNLDLSSRGIYSQNTLIIQEGKILNSEKTREYLLLELYKKDTKGAFDDIEIKKVYDDNWSEKEKLEAIEKINESFGSEMFVFDKSPNV